MVLNWWAIWCRPCIEETPELNELVGEYEREPVEFVAIADNSASEVREFLRSRDFRYQQAVAAAGTTEIFGERFPRHVVVGPDGTVVYNRSGYGSGSLEPLREALDSVLGDRRSCGRNKLRVGASERYLDSVRRRLAGRLLGRL